jgi:hypothetical protein
VARVDQSHTWDFGCKLTAFKIWRGFPMIQVSLIEPQGLSA